MGTEYLCEREMTMRIAGLLVVGALSLGAQSIASYTSFVLGSGYSAPPAVAVASGQITTFFVGGLPQTAAGLAKVVAVFTTPYVTTSVRVYSVKPVDASTLAMTVQIPFGIATPAERLAVVSATRGYAIQFAETDQPAGDLCGEGACAAPVQLTIVATNPHIITTCDLFYGGGTTAACQLAVTHQDGSIVTSDAPARAGEVVTVWALGLGDPASGPPTPGGGPVAMDDILLETFFAGGAPSSTGSTPYLFAGLASSDVGLYQINFAIPEPPAGLPGCSSGLNGGNLEILVLRPLPISTFGGTGVATFGVVQAGLPDSICVSAN